MANWLARAKKEETPLIDGNTVTFVWKGKKAPYLHLESERFQAVEMEKQGKNVWIYQVELPLDSYLEYNYATEKNQSKTIVPDPFNERLFDTGVGHFNHYFSMPECQHSPLIKRKKGIPRGTVSKHVLKFGQMRRKIWLYQPVSNEPVPLLLVYDGKDYKQRGKIVQIVDNLIAEKRIRPMAMALIDNGGESRFIEYNQSEATLGAIGEYVLPLAQKHLNLLDIAQNTGAYVVMGASMGGLMSVYTSLRLPYIFGHAISQAGAFFQNVFQNEPSLIKQWVAEMPVVPIKIWLDVGTFDFLQEDNQVFHKMLSDKGYEVVYREYSAGHNYTAWRDALPEALITMFGV